MPNQRLEGTGSSPGIATGKALLIPKLSLNEIKTSVQSVAEEKERLLNAVQKTKDHIEHVKKSSIDAIGEEKAQVFEAHLMMLEDPEFVDASLQAIEQKELSAEQAVLETAEKFIGMFEKMTDTYLRERAADIREISSQVLQFLEGHKPVDLANLTEPVVVIAHELTAAQTATMDRKKVLGFVTEVGGKTSHTAIMARSLEIPAVLGINEITSIAQPNQTVVLDGESGQVVLGPDQKSLEEFEERKAQQDQEQADLKKYLGQKATTLDGKEIKLEANMGALQDLPLVHKHDADGVGLLRTEFLFMNRTEAPDEEEQFEFYKTCLESLGSKPVVIRTLDIGGDKHIPYLQIDEEVNPFMGLRALRYCLQNKDLFRTQLRALLRASHYGNLSIMFPFVTTMTEVKEAKKLLTEVQESLSKNQVPFAENIKVGIMIEIPAAAIIADQLAKEVDFFSIGTNDLIQYICAVDRTNEAVNDLYDAHHPAVLRTIAQVIQVAKKAGIGVAVCGEMAGTPEFIPTLIGMGLEEFSMTPPFILRAKKIIHALSFEEEKKKLIDL